MKRLTVNEQGQIQITGKWKAGELLAISDELRRVALDVEIDFGQPETNEPSRYDEVIMAARKETK